MNELNADIACITGKLGRPLTEAETDDVQRLTTEIADQWRRRPDMSLDQIVAENVNRRLSDLEVKRLAEKTRRINDARLDKQFIERVLQASKTGRSHEAATNTAIGADVSGAEGSRQSISHTVDSASQIATGRLLDSLERAGLLKLLHQPDMERHIVTAMAAQTEPGINLKAIPKEAQIIGKILSDGYEAQRIQLNRYGDYTPKLKGYTGATKHDLRSIKQMGVTGWGKLANKLFDFEMMGVLPQERQAWIQAAYKNITESGGGILTGFRYSKSYSHSREIIFKGDTPENRIASAMEYNAAAGGGNFIEGIISGYFRRERDIAVKATIGSDVERFRKKHLIDPDTGKLYRKANNMLSDITGEINLPHNTNLAYATATYRAWNVVTMLGGALKSYVLDAPIIMWKMQSAGVDFLSAHKNVISALGNMNTPEARQYAWAFGVGIDGFRASLLSDIGRGAELPGQVTKHLNTFFHLNGQHWWTNRMQRGVAIGVSALHARNADRAFAELPEAVRRSLQKYNITESDWNTIRQNLDAVDGRAVIDTRALHDAHPDVSQRYVEAVSDIVHTSVLKPDAYIRTMLNQGHQRGTPTREMLDVFMQFKSFPATFMRHVWGELYNNPQSRLPGMLMAVELMGMAYMADAAFGLAEGRKPGDLNDPKYLTYLFVRSGAGALFGDLVVGSAYYAGRGSESFAANIFKGATGPGGGQVWDTAKGAYNTFELPFKNEKQQMQYVNNAVTRLQKSLPYNNLFYVKPVTNYALFNILRELAEPGSGAERVGWGKKYGSDYYEGHPFRPDRNLMEDIGQ